MLVVGRRRRAAYAQVQVRAAAATEESPTAGRKKKSAKKKSLLQSGTISASLASNLRLRHGDKFKIMPLEEKPKADDTDEVSSSYSGDLLLLQVSSPPQVTALTLSPLEDSLLALQASEGGDDINDSELLERFVTPYFEALGSQYNKALLKKGHVLTLADENGKRLEFMVTQVDLPQEQTAEEAATKSKDDKEAESGTFCISAHNKYGGT